MTATVDVEEITAERERLRDDARRLLGVAGDGGRPPRLRALLRDNRVSVYPLAALGTLAVVDTFQAYAFTVLTPEISRSLGIGVGALSLLVTLKTLSLSLSPLPIAAMVQRHPRRALVCIVTAALWGVATLLTGFVTATLLLALVLVADGLTTGSTAALHQPLLMDHYPPASRVRVLSIYRSFDSLGNVLAPLLVAALAGSLGFTWRGVFVVFGVACLAVVPFTLRLRDPGFGRWDTQLLRKQIHDDTDALGTDDVSLGFFEIVRRLLLVPTVKKLLVGFAVFGILLVPFQTFLSLYLDEELGYGPGRRGLFFAFASAVTIVALTVYGSRGERLFRENPRKLVEQAGLFIALGVVLIVAAVAVPYEPLTIALFSAALALIALLFPALSVAMLSVVPAHMRPHCGALIGIFLGGVGGIAGAVLLGGMSTRYGVTGSLVSLLVPGVLGGLLLRRAGADVQADLDRMIDEVLEDEQLKTLAASGQRLPTLSCRGIDFSYGQLQVLFDVDFTVDAGEMVALLGTNGAGKSTLLKVISGIGLPQRGSVRYRGQDITYLDAERRTRLGITQVPGGRAVFGPLTVMENLRAYGYTLGTARRELDGLVDECLDAFPRLAERRNSLASQLSGGEQQMLGLSKALIMRPRVLVIDELSLGLAPIVVGQLLEMVRRINATGTAVVLVEQSVNIALNLVEHAYFMEKGEMRFDGPARDLLARDDLLRAVFLKGAGAAT
ncbi:MAG: branched-chain amino acid transport system ATP-binding protein livF [Frankiaceae bacterium]|nr:branched-chain amino acid transport system ATP-binding protein livF [Frankiaceae bacterium]